MESWIWPFTLSVAAIAVTLSLFVLLRRTRPRSQKSSSAADAWRTEYDLELAELKDTVRGLSSTLRKLHGRESQRLRRDSPESPSLAVDKNALREKYGIVPRARGVDHAD